MAIEGNRISHRRGTRGANKAATKVQANPVYEWTEEGMKAISRYTLYPYSQYRGYGQLVNVVAEDGFTIESYVNINENTSGGFLQEYRGPAVDVVNNNNRHMYGPGTKHPWTRYENPSSANWLALEADGWTVWQGEADDAYGTPQYDITDQFPEAYRTVQYAGVPYAGSIDDMIVFTCNGAVLTSAAYQADMSFDFSTINWALRLWEHNPGQLRLELQWGLTRMYNDGERDWLIIRVQLALGQVYDTFSVFCVEYWFCLDGSIKVMIGLWPGGSSSGPGGNGGELNGGILSRNTNPTQVLAERLPVFYRKWDDLPQDTLNWTWWYIAENGVPSPPVWKKVDYIWPKIDPNTGKPLSQYREFAGAEGLNLQF